MSDTVLIEFDRQTLHDTFARDAAGNRLSIEISEPDTRGISEVTVTRHPDDNPIHKQRHQIARYKRTVDAKSAEIDAMRLTIGLACCLNRQKWDTEECQEDECPLFYMVCGTCHGCYDDEGDTEPSGECVGGGTGECRLAAFTDAGEQS